MTQKNASFPQLAALLLLLPLAVPARAASESTPAPASAPTPAARPPAAAAMSPRSPLPSPAPPRAPRAPRLTGGYLGVELVDLTPDLREHFGAPRDVGVMVGRVEPGSPAARAGLEVGDVVTAIGDEPVHDSWGLSGEISSREGSELVEMTLVRAGKRRQIGATLERREREGVDVGRWIFPPTPSIPPVPPIAAPPGAPPLPPMPPVGPALERLGRLLESDDFQDQIRAYQLRVDAEVEKRMRELEVRLKELERRLQDGDRRR